jgi:hypothetical protein
LPQVIAFETRTGVSVGAGSARPPQVAAAGASGAVPHTAPDGLAEGLTDAAGEPQPEAARAHANRSAVKRRGLIGVRVSRTV